MTRTHPTRKHLSRDINQLDQRLSLQQDILKKRRAQTKSALRQVNPLWFAGIGFVAGAFTGYHGVHGVYRFGSIGFRTQHLFQLFVQQLMSLTSV